MSRRSTFLLLASTSVLLLLVVACQSTPTATPEPFKTPRPVYTDIPSPESLPTETPTIAPTPTPTLDPNVNPLTGEPVADPETLRHRPILVRYGHDRIARPQSGLSSADLVYEELAEAGFVTRITGAFLSTLPEVVGPIRSARPAVIEMLQQLNAVLVYAGASHGTQQLLDQQPYPQYCHVCKDAYLFYRVTDKPSPHNLYTKLPSVRERMIAQNVDTPADLRGLVFDATAPAGSPATQIHIPYPGEAPTDYKYDAASGTYLRFVQGVAHTDALNNKQLAPANVIILYAEHRNSDIVEDSLGNLAILIKWLGEGRALVCRDGVMIEGKWLREAPSQMTRFVDAAGNDIPLKPGQSWIEIVPLNYDVTVQ